MSKAIKKIKKVAIDPLVDIATLGQKDAIMGVVEGVTGITAANAAKEQAKIAANTAKQQQADIAKQEKLIENERKKNAKISEERSSRMAQNLLLSGAETGTAKKTTLLGAK